MNNNKTLEQELDDTSKSNSSGSSTGQEQSSSGRGGQCENAA